MRMTDNEGRSVYYNIVVKDGQPRAVIKAIGDHRILGRDKQRTKSRTFAQPWQAEQWLRRHGYAAD